MFRILYVTGFLQRCQLVRQRGRPFLSVSGTGLDRSDLVRGFRSG
jgi:hypothetical protein